MDRKQFKNMLKKATRTYLQPIRNTMHEPIEGRSKTTHANPTQITKTLISNDATLISATNASKIARQHTVSYPKHATPCPHGHGAKGELSFKKTQNDTTHKQQRRTQLAKGFHQTPMDTTTAQHATPSGEWLGLRADEGRGKRRNAPGRRMQPKNRGHPNETSQLTLRSQLLLHGAETPRTEAS